MPDISKITLPSGNTYDIKDAVAREMISGGVTFLIQYSDGVPDVAKIPQGLVITYEGTDYTGTYTARVAGAEYPGAFFLIKSTTKPELKDVYDEYVIVKPTSDYNTWFWEKIGDTQIDLSDVVTGVILNKQTDVRCLP